MKPFWKSDKPEKPSFDEKLEEKVTAAVREILNKAH